MKTSFALEAGGPLRLEITRGLTWKNAQITLDGRSLLVVPNDSALRKGMDVTLPDGSSLSLKLNWTGGLELRLDGQPLPASAAAPETKIKYAAGVLYYIAALNLALGLYSSATHSKVMAVEPEGAPGIIVFGALMLLFGYFTSRKSLVSLGLGLALYSLDTVLSIGPLLKSGNPGGIGIARVFFTIALVRGLQGILEYRREQQREAMFTPIAVAPVASSHPNYGAPAGGANLNANEIAWPRQAQAYRGAAPPPQADLPPMATPAPLSRPSAPTPVRTAPVFRAPPPPPPAEPLPWRSIGIGAGALALVFGLGFGVWALFLKPPSCPEAGNGDSGAPFYVQLGRTLREPPAGGHRPDPNSALACYLLACEKDSVDGCVELADTLQHESVSPRSLGQRVGAALEKSCSASNPHACEALVESRRDGKGIPGSADQPLVQLRELCRSEGDVSFEVRELRQAACRGYLGFTAPSEKFAAPSATEECVKNPGACAELAARFNIGTGLPLDPLLARVMLHWACEVEAYPTRPQHRSMATSFPFYSRSPRAKETAHPACFDAFSIGEELTERRPRSAAECKEGKADACFLHAAAIVVDAHDITAVADELKDSCTGGSLSGCAWWGEAQRESGDFESAHKTFADACEKGHPYACDWLGYMSRFGEAGAVDLNEAREHYQRACDLGYPHGCDSAKALK